MLEQMAATTNCDGLANGKKNEHKQSALNHPLVLLGREVATAPGLLPETQWVPPPARWRNFDHVLQGGPPATASMRLSTAAQKRTWGRCPVK